MGIIFSILNIVIGLIMAVIGFKVVNPYKNEPDPEKETEFYKKNGTIFRLGGLALLAWGIYKTIGYL